MATGMSLTPPWRFSDSPDAGELVAFAPAHKAMPYIVPMIYGRSEFPNADARMPDRIEYRDKKIIKYTEKTLIPRRIVLNKDGSIHSESFRRKRTNYHGGLKHKGDDLFHPRRDDYKNTHVKLDHPIYYVDTEHPDIFGHFLIEVLPDLWGFHLVKSPKLKLASSVKMSASYLKMLSTLGIFESDIIHISGPTSSDEIYMPSPAILRRRYIDPIGRDVFDRVRNLALSSSWQSKDRIYVSRSKAPGRGLENEKEVEDVFFRYGFTIIHPQEMAIEDQIKAFRDAKMIAGTGGSAMHNAIYSGKDAKVLILATDTWFVLADSFICNKKGQLGYVFGETTVDNEKLPERHKSEWVINLKEVESAILSHFSL